MRKVLIIGATSAIAQETAKLLAADGDRLFLVGRSEQKLALVAQDLRVRTQTRVEYCPADLSDFDRHPMILAEATHALGGLDTVLIAHGTLPDQKACEQSVAKTEQELRTNFLSAVSLLTLIANQFERQRHGCIAVISSVAGDRGRQSNYVYGAAKGGLSIFLQGLRNRLQKAGVNVITIKPGFVDTPMTQAFKKGVLWAQPATVARGIHRAMARKRDVVYLPWFWRGIMAAIKATPESIFCRLSL
jgi:decaprenylphospho-beta-D-erythro-pentofuranosid-2-ulose 2-reductase